MADENKLQEIAKIEAGVLKLKSTDWQQLEGQNLAPEDQLGSEVLGFARCVIDTLAEIVDRIDLHGLLPTSYEILRLATRDINDVLDQIRAYNSKTIESPGTINRDNHSQHLINMIDTNVRRLIHLRVDLLTKAITNAEQELKQKLDAANALNTRAKANSKAAQEAVAAATAHKEAKEFSEAEKKYLAESLVWIGASIVSASAILVISAISVFMGAGPPLPTETWTAAANLSHFAARALALSIISFLLVVCVRNYRSAKHNAITNGHRAKALNTFRLLKDSTTGRAQDLILVQATTAIFSPQPTGYVDGATGPGTHVSELLRVVQPDNPEKE